MEATREKFADWLAGRLRRPIVQIVAWDGAPAYPTPDNPERYWFDFPARLERELYQLTHTVHLGDAVPVLFPFFGPGVLGACLGGRYHYNFHTFWYDQEQPSLTSLDEIERFRLREDNFWWRAVRDYMDLLLAHAQGRYVVGLTDIGGGMDILAGLRGTHHLHMDLLLNPKGVKRALAVVYEEWWKMFEPLAARLMDAQGATALWTGFYCEAPCYIFQNDFSCMISEEHFREFDWGHLQALSSRVAGSMYHLDGPGALRHLDALLELEHLRMIQWIPGAGAPGGDFTEKPGIGHWNEVLKKIQRAGKVVELHLYHEDVIPTLDLLEDGAAFIRAYCPDPATAHALAERLHGRGVL